jgi:hypothetical protein
MLDGAESELTYSSPRHAEGHDELGVLETLPWWPEYAREWQYYYSSAAGNADLGRDLAINGVTLAPGKVVINEGSPTVVKALEKAGVEVLQVDFSESQRFAIAGLHCATLELLREQPEPRTSSLPPAV